MSRPRLPDFWQDLLVQVASLKDKPAPKSSADVTEEEKEEPKQEKPAKAEKVERQEKAKPEKPEKPEKPDKKHEKAEKAEKPSKQAPSTSSLLHAQACVAVEFHFVCLRQLSCRLKSRQARSARPSAFRNSAMAFIFGELMVPGKSKFRV